MQTFGFLLFSIHSATVFHSQLHIYIFIFLNFVYPYAFRTWTSDLVLGLQYVIFFIIVSGPHILTFPNLLNICFCIFYLHVSTTPVSYGLFASGSYHNLLLSDMRQSFIFLLIPNSHSIYLCKAYGSSSTRYHWSYHWFMYFQFCSSIHISITYNLNSLLLIYLKCLLC